MAHALVELSDTTSGTSEHVVVVDYGRGTPWLCRSGIWVGITSEFTEQVILSYEHDPDELYVGWSLNGTVVSTPGFPPSIPSGIPGLSTPGAPDVLYMTPVGGLYHRISLMGTPGMDKTCVYVQVLYATFDAIAHGKPSTYGPAMTVCLSGAETTWPPDKLDAERQCLQRLWDLIHRYRVSRHVSPGDPVEGWMARVHGEDALRLKGLAEALEQLESGADQRLARAVRAELGATFERLRMQGRIVALGAMPAATKST